PPRSVRRTEWCGPGAVWPVWPGASTGPAHPPRGAARRAASCGRGPGGSVRPGWRRPPWTGKPEDWTWAEASTRTRRGGVDGQAGTDRAVAGSAGGGGGHRVAQVLHHRLLPGRLPAVDGELQRDVDAVAVHRGDVAAQRRVGAAALGATHGVVGADVAVLLLRRDHVQPLFDQLVAHAVEGVGIGGALYQRFGGIGAPRQERAFDGEVALAFAGAGTLARLRGGRGDGDGDSEEHGGRAWAGHGHSMLMAGNPFRPGARGAAPRDPRSPAPPTVGHRRWRQASRPGRTRATMLNAGHDAVRGARSRRSRRRRPAGTRARMHCGRRRGRARAAPRSPPVPPRRAGARPGPGPAPARRDAAAA